MNESLSTVEPISTPETRELSIAIAKSERLFDLVRHQRAELHDAGLISDKEYAEIAACQDSKRCVERLESYDEVTAKLENARAALKDLEWSKFMQGYRQCPCCRADAYAHHPACALAAALKD